jgi:predicted HTH transcriptional regulator
VLNIVCFAIEINNLTAMVNESQQENSMPLSETAKVLPEPNVKYITGGIRAAKKQKRIVLNQAAATQAKILVHIYKNEGVSMKQLRSLFNLTGITSYRHLGALKRIGVIKWKGSHKAGGYVLTDFGKKFVESDGWPE